MPASKQPVLRSVLQEDVFSELGLEKLKDFNILMLIMAFKNADTLLPELHSFLGPEKFLEFLDIFANVTFKVPSSQELLRGIEDYVIYKKAAKIERNAGKAEKLIELSRCYREFARKYNSNPVEIEKRYETIKKIISKQLKAL